MSQRHSVGRGRRRSFVRLGVKLLIALGASIAGGVGVAWLASNLGRVDKAVLGPALPPLAITLSFVFAACGIATLARKRLFQAFDAFLPPGESALRAITLILVAAAIYEVVRVFLFMFINYWPTDLPSYHYAGRALIEGMDPYDPVDLNALAGRRVFPYLYPPLLAMLWTPLAKMPLEIAHAIWQSVSLMALGASALLCIRLANPETPTTRAATVIAAFLVPLGHPFYSAAQHGSLSVVLSFLLILFFERMHRGKEITAGIVLAIACGLKGLPALLLVYLAVKRRFRALVVALIAGGVLLAASVSIVGLDLHLRFVVEVMSQIGYAVHSDLGFDPAYHPANQSLNGFLSNLFDCGGNWGCSLAVVAICAAFALPTLWLVSKRREIDGAEASALVFMLLLVSPITWLHHMVLLLLPATVFTAKVVSGSWRPRWWFLIAVAYAAILANDFGRPVTAIKFFGPWHHLRFSMLVLLYVVSWSLLRNERERTER